jgi:hypothetical protein
MKKKRDLLAELTEGFDVLAAQRTGKRTLRTYREGQTGSEDHPSGTCQSS